MKTPNKLRLTLSGILGVYAVATTALTVWSQTAPFLEITPAGSNQFSVTITNGISTDSYELWWTPVLGNTTQYPWSAASVGNIGQTNFVIGKLNYPAVFYRVLLDTNAVPLWENANPGNPGTNILKVTIASPANGSNLN